MNFVTQFEAFVDSRSWLEFGIHSITNQRTKMVQEDNLYSTKKMTPNIKSFRLGFD